MPRRSLVLDGNTPDAVRRNEARFRSIVSALTDFLFVTSVSGRLLTDMPAWRAVTGQTVDELLGFGWLDGVHPDDRERTRAVWDEAVRTGGDYVVEYRIAGPGGTVHLDVRGAPVRNEAGEVTEWIGGCTDVTEQRRLADAVQAERETLQSVIEQAQTAVVMLRGRELAFSHFNDAYLAMVPAGRAKIGVPLVEALPETAHLVPTFHKVMDDDERVEYPELAIAFDHPRSFEGFRYYSVSYSAVTFSGGERGVLGVGVETTEEVRRRSDLERRLATERRLGADLQHALLPQSVPAAPGLDVAVRYRPAAEHTGVGGDWYDLVPLADGRVVLVAGDVSGTGLRAATGMAQLQSAVRAYALEGLDPGAILDRTSRFCAQLEVAELATAVVAVLDPGTGTLEWASAQHPPPLLVRDGEPAELLRSDPQPPLGQPSAAYEVRRTQLPPDAALVLYTDGLVARRGVFTEVALEELRLVAGGRWAFASELRDAIVRGVPHGDDDDLALLVCRRPAGLWSHRRFDPEPRHVSEMRMVAGDAAAELGFPGEVVDRVRIVVSEAATNAVVHARRHEPGPVDLTLAVTDAELVVVVTDHGMGVTPRPDSPGAGVGVQIMRSLADRVEWSRPETGGTQVTMGFARP